METKKCPFCGEEIMAEARKCPHCQQWIGRAQQIIRHPAFSVGVPLLVFLVVYLLIMFTTGLFPQGKKFSDHANSIRIVSHKMAFSSDGKKVYVIGKIKNVGDITWKRIKIKADFFDTNEELIDRAGVTLWEELSPGETTSFKATSHSPQERLKYADYTVSVVIAEDAATRW